MAQYAAHGNDLAFVMECVGQKMMEDERRRTDGVVSIGEMKLRVGIELFVRQTRQIGKGQAADLLLEESGGNNIGTSCGIAIDIGESLEGVDPKSLAVEDVDHLFLQRGKPEAR